ncbi:MAG: TolC family protein [Myxococcota bacterium]
MTLALLLLLGAAPADVPRLEQPLSLAEVLTSTRELHPQLVAARTDLDAADGELQTAEGAFDPAWRTRVTGVPVSGYPQLRVDSIVEAPTPLWGATFFGGYRLGTGKFQSYYGERETWTGGELRAGAAVPILRNGPIDRRRATQARAELGRSIAGLSLQQQQLELDRLATLRYWDWVAAGRRRQIARELLQIARDRDGQLEARTRAGDVARFDQQDNLRALVQREALVVQAQRALEQAAFELSLFLRDPRGAPLIPSDERLPTLVEAPPAPEPEGVEEVAARRPDVKRLLDQKRQAELELRLARNQLLPALDVGATISKDLGASRRPDTDALGPTELELSAVLDVPILYRAPLGRLKSASATLAKLDAQLGLARDRVKVELDDAQSALRAATERLTLARRELDVAIDLEKAERRRFELGEGSLLFVNLREQTTVEARLREVDALVDGHRALAALRVALARTESK